MSNNPEISVFEGVLFTKMCTEKKVRQGKTYNGKVNKQIRLLAHKIVT